MTHDAGRTMLISETFADFAAGLKYESVPQPVRERAKLLMLDAIGIAFSSSKYDFASKALAGLSRFGTGEHTVINSERKLALRDAVTMNGILVHGLDYDDTYLPGAVHMTSSNVPCLLGLGADTKAGGRELLAALVVGLEAAARIGAASNGGFQKVGFHPTAICGAMACSLLAGRLIGLDREKLKRAQGIALSLASGTMQPMLDGTWTKRLHPGAAAAAGITAAALAEGGFLGPSEAYEGRFGFYNLFLADMRAKGDPAAAVAELGERWEFARSSVKLFPACHQSHAFMNAAIKIASEHRFAPQDIERVDTLVADVARELVCDPMETKRRPTSSYMAQFSLPYGMAACLTRRRFGLEEIEAPAYTEPGLLALAQKVHYQIDPNAGYPKKRTGEVIVTLKNGTKLRERQEIDPDAPAGAEEIERKYFVNAEMAISHARAETIRDVILALDEQPDARAVTRVLAA
jgi:2-methylcitrate dehydratase PrpD